MCCRHLIVQKPRTIDYSNCCNPTRIRLLIHYMNKLAQHFIAWLTVLSLLFAMVGSVAAANTAVLSDSTESSMHSTHAPSNTITQSHCCDDSCQCETMISDCASGGYECTVSGSSSAALAATRLATLRFNHDRISRHSRFAVITRTTQPDIPPPSLT